MTDLVAPGEDDGSVLAMQPVVRRHNTAKLRALVEGLEPYVDGSYGPVNPRMCEVYMRALRELALLYRVYDPPKEKVAEEQEPALRADVVRAQVLRQLEELSGRSAPPARVNGSGPAAS